MPASSPKLNERLRTNREAAADITAEQQRAEITRARLESRWHKEGWRTCEDCDGEGYAEDMGDRLTCSTCSGSGEVKMTFFDWIDELEQIEVRRTLVREDGEAA